MLHPGVCIGISLEISQIFHIRILPAEESPVSYTHLQPKLLAEYDKDSFEYAVAYTHLTYARVEQLRQMYEEALEVEDVVGIVIGTRPDCVSAELLDYLEELNRRTFVLVEYGIESVNDETLQRINRGHDFACCRSAVERTLSLIHISLFAHKVNLIKEKMPDAFIGVDVMVGCRGGASA